MKIIFVIAGNIGDSAMSNRLFLASYLAKEGVKTYLILDDFQSNKNWVKLNFPNSENVYYLSNNSIIGYFKTISKLFDNLKPDYVHLIAAGLKNVLLLSLRKSSTTKYIIDLDELKFTQSMELTAWWKKKLYLFLEQQALKSSNIVIGVSQFMIDYFTTQKSVNQYFYLPYAYEPSLFESLKFEQKAHEIRKQYSGKKILVYMGNFYSRNDSFKVLELTKKMENYRQEIVFLILGGGPELESKKQWVKDNGLDDFVFMLGYVMPNELANSYLKAADVLLFPIEDSPKNKARCPNKIFQYIAVNRPIVTNRVGEVEHNLGSHGYYFDFDNFNSFEEMIFKALDESELYDVPQLSKIHSWEKRASDYYEYLLDNLTQE